MKILKSDIDALIDAAHSLQGIANDLRDKNALQVIGPEQLKLADFYQGMAHRCRKVYILLLWASTQNEWPMHRLCVEDLPDDALVNEAIRNLCPAAFGDGNVDLG
jgi:hypothetical protein